MSSVVSKELQKPHRVLQPDPLATVNPEEAEHTLWAHFVPVESQLFSSPQLMLLWRQHRYLLLSSLQRMRTWCTILHHRLASHRTHLWWSQCMWHRRCLTESDNGHHEKPISGAHQTDVHTTICGEAGKNYWQCPYRQLGLRGFPIDIPRPP